MCSLFKDHQSQQMGVLFFFDVTNAFNSLNHALLLWNTRVHDVAQIFMVFVDRWATLVPYGTDNFLFIREGVTQGDPFLCSFMLLEHSHLSVN